MYMPLFNQALLKCTLLSNTTFFKFSLVFLFHHFFSCQNWGSKNFSSSLRHLLSCVPFGTHRLPSTLPWSILKSADIEYTFPFCGYYKPQELGKFFPGYHHFNRPPKNYLWYLRSTFGFHQNTYLDTFLFLKNSVLSYGLEWSSGNLPQSLLTPSSER